MGHESGSEARALPLLASPAPLAFHSPSPPRLPGMSVKGSFVDSRLQGALKMQHLRRKNKGKTVTTGLFYPGYVNKNAVL